MSALCRNRFGQRVMKRIRPVVSKDVCTRQVEGWPEHARFTPENSPFGSQSTGTTSERAEPVGSANAEPAPTAAVATISSDSSRNRERPHLLPLWDGHAVTRPPAAIPFRPPKAGSMRQTRSARLGGAPSLTQL